MDISDTCFYELIYDFSCNLCDDLFQTHYFTYYIEKEITYDNKYIYAANK